MVVAILALWTIALGAIMVAVAMWRIVASIKGGRLPERVVTVASQPVNSYKIPAAVNTKVAASGLIPEGGVIIMNDRHDSDVYMGSEQ